MDLIDNELGQENVKNIELISEAIKNNKNLQQLDLIDNGLGQKNDYNEKEKNYTDCFRRKLQIFSFQPYSF